MAKMPAFYLKCNKCSKELRRILTKFTEIKCDCGEVMQRTDKTNPSAMIKEVLDNGAMIRKVERIHNIDELVKQRSKEPDEPGVV
jgi:DNA-directed RNA polymerase subunit RPC12/RpoP